MTLRFKIFIIIALFAVASCSTEKNTASRRFFHNITTRYNIYFNGYTAFDKGIKTMNDAKENYVQLIPIYKNEPSEIHSQMGGDMDIAIQKSVKAIKMHSITVKPDLKKGKGKLTPEQKAFMKKSEYNKWIDDAYLLIGKSHYYKGEYQVAMKSLQTILAKFRTEPIRFDALYWIARCYASMLQPGEAENFIKKITDDAEYKGNLDNELEMLKADIAIKQKKYEVAINILQKQIPNIKKKNKKARISYLMAQLENEVGNKAQARKYYEEVIKMNPSYDMVFTSKIKMAESYEAEQGNSDKLKKSLKKMLNDDKNIDYQDQIYYALAQIAMQENDEKSAEENFLQSTLKSTNNQNQKALSFLALAQLYFKQMKYLKAGAYYDSTMTAISPSFKDYQEISVKNSNLHVLTDNLLIVNTEDSLQRVAQMDETKRNDIINDLIAKVKEQENQQKNKGLRIGYDPFQSRDYSAKSSKGKWLFYNAQAMSIGKNEFRKMWGNRKNEDHWRRSNKAMIVENDDENQNTSGVETDNKKPQFYLQNLPLNDSLMAISKEKEAQALFKVAETYDKNLHAYKEAEEKYLYFVKKFPNHKLEVEVYFNLYMLYTKNMKNKKNADYARNKILEKYPNSKYAQILSNPNYLEQLRQTKDQVSNLYEKCYLAYKADQYSEALQFINQATEISPQNDLIAGFNYFKAMTYGKLGNRDSMQNILNDIVEKYPDAPITPQAQKTLAVLKSGKYDPNYFTQNASDKDFYYIFISDDADAINKIKFLLVNLSVDLFPSKNLKVEEGTFKKQKQIIVKSFNNQQDAMRLFSEVQNSTDYRNLKANSYHAFCISKSNYDKLKKLPIIEKYMTFFNSKF